MLFNTPEYYFFFFPIVTIAYFYFATKTTHSITHCFLTAASFAFYAYWDYRFLPLLIGSITLNYTFSIWVTKSKLLLTFGIVSNLLTIAYYKYFFLLTNGFTDPINGDYSTNTIPLAISFFTFQQIAYLIDCRTNAKENPTFLDYALFISFFPQLIAGPIVRSSEFIPQLKKRIHFNKRNLNKGITIFTIGLFKKFAIGDTLGIWVDNFYQLETFPGYFAWLAAISYTLQLYYDFSGYTDMAIGSALVLNINLPQNFNSPLKALSVSDFWKRWHLTLTRWLRDYLYIPIGGNRNGETRRRINVFIVFLAGGLWHGSNWTFVTWGFAHAIALTIESFWKKGHIKLPKALAWTGTFIFVCLSFISFRSNNLGQAIQIYEKLFDFSTPTTTSFFTVLDNWIWLLPPNDFDNFTINNICGTSFLTFTIILTLITPNTQKLLRHLDSPTHPIFASLVKIGTMTTALFCAFHEGTRQFLYFQF